MVNKLDLLQKVAVLLFLIVILCFALPKWEVFYPGQSTLIKYNRHSGDCYIMSVHKDSPDAYTWRKLQ